MYGKNSSNMPIGMAMALAHNVESLNVFLNMDDKSQDELIVKAREAKTKRELQKMIDNLSKIT